MFLVSLSGVETLGLMISLCETWIVLLRVTSLPEWHTDIPIAASEWLLEALLCAVCVCPSVCICAVGLGDNLDKKII